MLVSARLTVVALLLAFGGCRAPEVDDRAEAARTVEEPAAAPAAIAITIDDLPWIGPVHEGETQLNATDRLLAALRRHDAPAVGFVNCDRTNPRDPILQRWLDAGMTLGNHTAAHLDLNRADLQQWLDDARRCDAFLRELTGDSTILFRYPFLHQGPTPERREAARELLDELESVNAHVTVDNSDWILAAAYGEAIRAG
ncbi:MAG TPA: polysaccharide deacetylase family protein, partial [Longimicrobiaceae bacterium]|nr:polysaccharide deacetylase family protein [Longimicrobiaceae bacterium]